MRSRRIADMLWERVKIAISFPRMDTSKQYREFAEECERLAKEAKDLRDKQSLLAMAQNWRDLAKEEDSKSGG